MNLKELEKLILKLENDYNLELVKSEIDTIPRLKLNIKEVTDMIKSIS